MNKEKIVEQIMEKTQKSKEECLRIYEIIERNRVVGRKNKEKMKQEFQESLQVSRKEADSLYNIAMEIQVKEFFS